jgi:hypothetical protein
LQIETKQPIQIEDKNRKCENYTLNTQMSKRQCIDQADKNKEIDGKFDVPQLQNITKELSASSEHLNAKKHILERRKY